MGRFTQPDSIIPESSQGTQAWDRYAYANNSPVKYSDPSGHFSRPPWLNPLNYNTLTFSVRGIGAAIIGANVDGGIAIDMRPIKNFVNYAKTISGPETIAQLPQQIRTLLTTMNGGIYAQASHTVGVEGEGSMNIVVGGTQTTTDEFAGISTPLDAEAPINLSLCGGGCVGGGATPSASPDSIDGFSEVHYSTGIGVGFEAGIDTITATDWIARFPHGLDGAYAQVPFFNENFKKNNLIK